MTYILDTDIIIAILRGNQRVARKAGSIVQGGGRILINAISYYEVKRGFLAVNDDGRLSKFEDFCRKFGMVLLDNLRVFDRASEIYASLRRKNQLIGDADILIAALADSQGFVMVSNNIQHFSRVEGLEVENWLQ